MRALEFLKEAPQTPLGNSGDLVKVKDRIIQKLQALPDDSETETLIDKIEVMLNDLGVGGRVASLVNRVEKIDDDDVKRAVRKVAKIVSTIDMTNEERETLFKKWNADKIVNTKLLTTGGTHTMEEIYRGYGTDPIITELVDDFNDVQSYGIGPGEFGLSCLSKAITGIGSGKGKGDLIINKKNVELKTTNVGSGRFKDRNYPSTSYPKLAENFYEKYKDIIEESKLSSTSGMNLSQLISLVQQVNNGEIIAEVKKIMVNLFRFIPETKTTLHSDVVSAISKGQLNQVKALYGRLNLDNYMYQKRGQGILDGTLFMDLPKKRMTYMTQSSDLAGSGMRLHISTTYPIALNDPGQDPYPQISIQQTSQQ